jgi:peptidoglycan/LPS O-acetylase OafA/YrhL
MLRFRRITTHNNFIPQIDGLRFVAIASVVLFHTYSALATRSAIPVPWPENLDLAKRGVELFFAISGFILGVPFASARFLNTPAVNLKRYFLRRLTRLEPPYIISLFVWAVADWVTAHRTLSYLLPHLLSSCVYMQNLIFGGFVGAVNSVAWSLEVEVQFYLLAPILAVLFGISGPRKRRIVMLLLILASGVLSLPLYRSTHFHYSIGYYLPFFLAGFLVCDLYVNRREWKVSFLWDLLALSLWPLVWILGRNVGHVLLPFAIVVLYLAAFRGRMCSAVFSNSAIASIGGMCYSIYLFHFLVIYLVKHVTQPIHFGQNFWFYFILQLCMILPFILVLCGGFFLAIERPCMDRNWPLKLWRWGRELFAPNLSRSSNCGAPPKTAGELVGP